MLIAQISDMHVEAAKPDDRRRTHAHFLRCVESLKRLDPPPDLVAVTGDLVEAGKLDEYALVKSALDGLARPYVVIPGNHDDVPNLRKAFNDHAYLDAASPFVQYEINDYALRVVALDTTIPQHDEGKLCAERLDWFARTLSRHPTRPTVVLMHHPPFMTGIRGMDDLGLREGKKEFADIVARHPNIQRILCGHIHRGISGRVGQTPVSVCPGTAHQIELNLTQRGALAYIFEPPGYLLHWLGPDGLVTHQAVVGDFPGPFTY